MEISKNNYLMVILLAILTIVFSLVSCTHNEKRGKGVIGKISEEGQNYIAYNGLFELNNNPWSASRDIFDNYNFRDSIDKEGYRITFMTPSYQIIDYYFYRETTTVDVFNSILDKFVSNLGDKKKMVYSEKGQVNEFDYSYKYFHIVGSSPYNEDDIEFRKTLAVMFCYNDSLQFTLSRLNNSILSFGEDADLLRKGKSLLAGLKFRVTNNLIINPEFYSQGIPEPLTIEELKKLNIK